MQIILDNLLKPLELPLLAENPLISVLVPNYNYARYIGESLDSILLQTYPYFEVIVCDDGSKDNSCEIIETYASKDSRIKLIRKTNGGVASALNTAYQESQGEIICILDADDVWLKNKLSKILEVFKSNPKSGFVIHNVIQIDAESKLIKRQAMFKQLASGWMAQYALENGGFVYNIPPASALCLRREVTQHIFPLNEKFTRNADSLIFRFAPFITEISSEKEVLSQFRLHGANTTSFSTLNSERLNQEQDTLERIYQEQKLFLQKYYGMNVAEKLTDLKCSNSVCHDLYLLTRLHKKKSQERQVFYRKLVNHPNFSSYHITQQFLFRWGEYLPDNIFIFLFNQIYGQSYIKQFFRRLTSIKNSSNVKYFLN